MKLTIAAKAYSKSSTRPKWFQQAAKDKRDELAGVDPEKDKTRWDDYVKMRDEYEKNALAYRDAEARLAEFTRTHGDDIDRYVQRLVA